MPLCSYKVFEREFVSIARFTCKVINASNGHLCSQSAALPEYFQLGMGLLNMKSQKLVGRSP